MKKLLLIIPFLSFISSLMAQDIRCQNIFVWNFSDENNIKNEYTKSLTDAVEEAMVNVSNCTVLQRRNFGTLEARVVDESNVQSVRDMKENIMKSLSTSGAEQVLFGVLTRLGQKEYELQLRIENLKTTRIVRMKSEDLDIEDLVDNSKKKEIVLKLVNELLGKPYGQVSLPREPALNPLIKNVDNGIDFFITDCIGDQANQTVTIYFTFANPRKPHQNITIDNGIYLAAPFAFAKTGDQFRCSSVTLAGEKNRYEVKRELPTNLRINGSVTFSNVLPQTESLELAKINVVTSDYDGEGNQKKGSIEIRNLKINWDNNHLKKHF
jgi:hypothetical protein